MQKAEIDTRIDKLVKVGKKQAFAVGDQLYCQVKPTGATSWIFRYRFGGKVRDMGLGIRTTPEGKSRVSLSAARDKVRVQRSLIDKGLDPLAEKQALKSELKNRKTFKDCALEYIELNESEWRNIKHRQQWRNTLRDYAYPIFGDQDITTVTRDQVLKVLKPLWSDKPETGRRVRQRIETIFDFAKASKILTGENPARWKGELELILPNTRKTNPVKHQRALPYAEIPQYWTDLSKQEGNSAYAMQLLLLCANRTGEVLGARWDEIDLKKKIWSIPGERMKAAVEHVIPLSEAAIDVIQSLPRDHEVWVFPAQRGEGHLSDMSLLMLLRRMKYDSKTTVHGFRSSFRDYIGEETSYPHRLAEHALAHQLENSVEKSYARGTQLKKRREMMEHWSNYCISPANKSASLQLRAVQRNE